MPLWACRGLNQALQAPGQMLCKRGVLGREDCLSHKVASSKLVVSSAASLFYTTAGKEFAVACRFFGYFLPNQKVSRISPDAIGSGETFPNKNGIALTSFKELIDIRGEYL
jgi:hypothetical protein